MATFDTVQEATTVESGGNPITVTLGTTPVEGNTLLAFVFYRNEQNNPTITGWTKDLDQPVEITNSAARRHTAVFRKTAGASESTSVTVDFDGSVRGLVHVLEVEGELAYDNLADNTADSGASQVNSLFVSPDATSQANSLLLAVLGVRHGGVSGATWSFSFTSEVWDETGFSANDAYLEVARLVVSTAAAYDAQADWGASESEEASLALIAYYEVSTGTDHTDTITDDVGVTDAGDYEAVTGYDDVGITDVVSSELVAGGTDHTATLTDPVGITDTPSTVRAIARSITDSVGVTSAPAHSRALPRTVTDSVGITEEVRDAHDQHVTATNLADEDIWISDQIVVAHAGADGRTLIEQILISEPEHPTAFYQGFRRRDEDVFYTDVIEVAITKAAEIIDDVAVTDARERAHAAERQPVDAVGITDTPLASRDISREVTDSVGVTDALDVAAPDAWTFGLVDSVGVTDDGTWAVERDAEHIGITDSVEVVGGTAVVVLVESVFIFDTGQAQPYASSQVGITDSVEVSGSFSRDVIDAVDLTDEIPTAIEGAVGIGDDGTYEIERAAELVGIGDSVTASSTGDGDRTLTDTVAVTDTGGAQPFDGSSPVGITDSVEVNVTSDTEIQVIRFDVVPISDLLAISTTGSFTQVAQLSITDRMTWVLESAPTGPGERIISVEGDTDAVSKEGITHVRSIEQ